jgi:membrane protease YdiL (CAAX protease family)
VLWALCLLATWFCLTVGGVIGLFAVAGLRKGGMPAAADIPYGVLLLVDLASKLAAVGALLVVLRLRKERLALVRPDPSPRRSAAGGALAGLAFLPILIGVGSAQDWFYGLIERKPETQDILERAVGGSALSFGMIAVFAVAIAPPFEELAFRGLLHSGLRTRFRPVHASLLSAFVFAAYHMNLDAIPAIFLLGLFLAYLRERTGGLTAPIAAHACYNAYQMAGVWMARPGG